MSTSSAKAVSPIKVIPLGGLGEIGMNCMVLESADEMILIDCGLLFSDLDHFGVEFVIPDFSYVIERKDKLSAIVVTHGHEDHIGAIPFALKAGLNVPIYASTFSALLLRRKLEEYTSLATADIRTFRMGDRIKLRTFEIETVSVNHSIVDAAALIISTPAGKVIHTGDFKVDPTPFFGKMMDLDTFKRHGDEGVLLLMSDSTNVERHEHSLSESMIYQSFEHLFAAAEGLTVVAMFASNIGRMGQVLDLAKKMNKKVICSGRTMEQNVFLGSEAGYLRDLGDVVITMDDFDKYDRKDIILMSTGSQAEPRSSLTRMSMGEHGIIKLQEGDTILMSSKFIPGNEKAIGRMINNLFKQGAEVLYEAVHDIHVSGHATRPELEQMLKLTRPKFFMPIHGEYRHLVHHTVLAKETGIPPENVVLAVDGDVLELSPDSLEVIDHLEGGRVLVEGRDGSDVSRLVLKDRRQMGEKGIVFSLMVRNQETGRIMSVPEIISKGLANEQTEAFLVEEGRKLVQRIIADYEAKRRAGDFNMDLQETIRVELRRFFAANIGKKPVVLPIILDM